MEDSASNNTCDEGDIQTYSITSKDICHLKNRIAALKAEVQAIDTSGSRSSPAFFQIASNIKSSLEKIEANPMIFTPVPSVSGDSPVKPEKTNLSVCRELIGGGIIAVCTKFEEQIVRLKTQGDIAAGEVYNFIDQLQDDDPTFEEYLAVIDRAWREILISSMSSDPLSER